jgi:hypothetical protein
VRPQPHAALRPRVFRLLSTANRRPMKRLFHRLPTGSAPPFHCLSTARPQNKHARPTGFPPCLPCIRFIAALSWNASAREPQHVGVGVLRKGYPLGWRRTRPEMLFAKRVQKRRTKRRVNLCTNGRKTSVKWTWRQGLTSVFFLQQKGRGRLQKTTEGQRNRS